MLLIVSFSTFAEILSDPVYFLLSTTKYQFRSFIMQSFKLHHDNMTVLTFTDMTVVIQIGE